MDIHTLLDLAAIGLGGLMMIAGTCNIFARLFDL